MYGSNINNKGKAEKNANVKEGPCIIPFKYKWKTHDECVDTDKGSICATSVSDRNTLKTYGYCNPVNKSKSKSKSPNVKKRTKKKVLKLVENFSKTNKRKTYKRRSPTKSMSKSKTKSKTKSPVADNTSFDSAKMVEEPLSEQEAAVVGRRLNEEFIDILGEFHQFLMKRGEFMRARAYQKAQESIMNFPDTITEVSQIIKFKGIGATITSKLGEYVTTGKIEALEKERNNPIHVFTEIYGIGPKKAKDLIEQKITTIEELKTKKDDVLNDKQLLGLQYYEDILKRIPRQEVENYEKVFMKAFAEVKNAGSSFEIVGSYRRGAKTSGDIDVCITDSNNDKTVFNKFIQKLVDDKVIVHKLTDGLTKTLVIAQLNEDTIARRVDFLYSPPDEYSFATLYFTGSKTFNTVMRQRALNIGYSLNEHGFYVMNDKKKGDRLEQSFPTEKSIFDFLGMDYKEPVDRIDGRSVVINDTKIPANSVAKDVTASSTLAPTSKPKSKTQSKKLSPKKATSPKNKTLKSKRVPPNKHIDSFKKQGIDYLKLMTEDELAQSIKYANDVYYNNPDKPAMSDNEYDIMRELMEKEFPSNPILKEIGAPIERNKVLLPYEMWSMDKIKPTTSALPKWLEKYASPGEYVLSAKLDGVSGLYTSEGDEPKLYTRGNGKVGQDVSHLIPYLNFPTDKDLVIRGEFIISKKVFEEHYAGKNSNARNLAAGIINKLSKSVKDYENLDFVAYEVIKPEVKPSYQMKHMEKLKLNTVRYEVINELSNDMLSAKLVSWRKNYDYDIDGIIVTHDKTYGRLTGNPDHAFAFKMVLSDQVAEAKVVDVIWTPSKDGFLKPKIRIEPIVLGGVKIEYATAFNASFIRNNKLGIGALVEIIRSGDVIPYIQKVVVPAETIKMPDEEYVWNETNVDIMLKDKSSNETVRLKNIAGFFVDIEVDGVGSGNIKKIINAGFDSVPKILAMSEADFLTVPGFKQTLATKAYTNIKKQIDGVSLITLMSATNIFGRGLAERKIAPIMEEYPDILVSKESNEDKIKKVMKVKGMAKKSAESFVDSIEDFNLFLIQVDLTHKLHDMPEVKNVNPDHPLYKKKIVMSGFRDKTLEESIKAVGGEIGTSISKNTFALLVKSVDETTGKIDQAKKLEVQIMTPTDFALKYI